MLKCFLGVIFLAFLALHTKRDRCGHMGLTPCLFVFCRIKCVCIPSIRSIVSFFFSGKAQFLGVWPYRYVYDVPLVTLIINIYGLWV